MGKKKSGSTNIAALVREYCAAHPDDKPLQIQKALAKKGHEVKTQYIATLRSNFKKQEAEAGTMGSEEPVTIAPEESEVEPVVKPAAEPRRARAMQSSAGMGDSKLKQVRIGALIQLRELGRELGGYQEVRDILDVLEDLAT